MTDKIEVGDWVVRDTGTCLHSGLEHGVEYEVIGAVGTLLRLRGVYPEDDWQVTYCNFTKVDPPKRHKHYKEIVAWANGEVIEYFSDHSEAWRVIREPSWTDTVQYRVKPKGDPLKVELAETIKSLKNQLDEATEEYNTYE